MFVLIMLITDGGTHDRASRVGGPTIALCYYASPCEQIPARHLRNACQFVDARSYTGLVRMASNSTTSHFHAPGNTGSITGTNYGTINNNFVSGNNQSKIISRIYLTDPEIDRSNVRLEKGDRTPGTCEWVLQDSRYLEWRKLRASSLWLTGGPGKGKTMIALHVTEVLSQESKKDNATLLYFFCSHQHKDRSEAKALIRGLLYQLLKQHPNLETHAESIMTMQNSDHILQSFEALWNIFTKMLCDRTLGDIICVLDGVDECDDGSRYTLASHFFGFVQSRASSETGSFKLLGLSRTLTEIDFNPQCNILMDINYLSCTSDDVEKFVEHSLERFARVRNFDKIREEVHKTLIAKAGGTFLWIGLVVKQMEKKKTASAILEVLNQSPDGLPSIYARLLRQIEEGKRTVVAEILRWVSISCQPLTLNELADALGYKSPGVLTAADILHEHIDQCADLFVIIPNDQFRYVQQRPFADKHMIQRERHRDKFTVVFHQGESEETLQSSMDAPPSGITRFVNHPMRPTRLAADDKLILFVHQSVKGFLVRHLENNDIGLTEFHVPEAPTHLTIALTALKYIQSSELQQRYVAFHHVDVRKKSPFLLYASLFWTLHAKKTPSTGLELLKLQEGFMHQTSGAQIRVNWFLSCLLETDRFRFSIELSKNRKDFSLFSIACWQGIESWLQPLLAGAEDTNSRETLLNFTDEGDTQPLAYVIQNGRQDMVSQLLEMGAVPTCEAFARALCYNQGAMFELLVKHGDVNTLDATGTTPLMNAVAAQNKEAVCILLGADADINVRGRNPKLSALDLAVFSGDKFSMGLLISQGASDLNIAVAACHACKFMQAMDNGTVVSLLGQLSPAAIPKYGRELLRRCAEHGAVDAVRFLLQNGASSSTVPRRPADLPAVYHAVASGHMDIFRLLLDHGARFNQLDKYGPKALCLAAAGGHSQGAFALLVQGVSASCRLDDDDKFPLFLAAESGRANVFEVLFMDTVDVNARTIEGETALMAAARKGHDGIVECLMQRGASIDARNIKGETALIAAAREGHDATVKRLVKLGALIDAEDMEGRTALHHAGLHGRKVILVTLARLAAKSSKDSMGKTAWQYAKEHDIQKQSASARDGNVFMFID